MYVILFNGPPQSGKDTLAQMLADHLYHVSGARVVQDSLSMPLRKIAYQMVGESYGVTASPPYEEFKNMYFEEFQRTGRQLMIDVSEKFLKTNYGESVMARMLCTSHIDGDGILLIRDSGFQLEIDPIVKAFGPENVYLVQVHRHGCDFSNDSREWVTLDGRMCMIHNNGDFLSLETSARRLHLRMVNQLGWKI